MEPNADVQLFATQVLDRLREAIGDLAAASDLQTGHVLASVLLKVEQSSDARDEGYQRGERGQQAEDGGPQVRLGLELICSADGGDVGHEPARQSECDYKVAEDQYQEDANPGHPPARLQPPSLLLRDPFLSLLP
jgi:hypothetical protein